MIINSLLDQDLYKFTMLQTILHRFPSTIVEYKFKCRTIGINLVEFIDDIKKEIKHLCTLRFTKNELEYLYSLRFNKSDFVDYLRLFQLQENFVIISNINNELDIKIAGPMIHTMMFEIFILSIISELYHRKKVKEANSSVSLNGIPILEKKIKYILENFDNGFKFIDYGTRRRCSFDWQEYNLCRLKTSLTNNFIGTSNVYFAMKYNLVPMGTMAHEYLQAMQAMEVRLINSQKFAFENWVQEYRGDLGIALTDVVGMDAFLKDFDLYFCKLFDGVRHDSGDPFVWTNKMLTHYEKYRIDAKTKTLVYSDSLTFEKCKELYDAYNNKAKLLFGLGNHLMNDVGYKHLNMVIKMTKCNNQPVAKVSDSAGKCMCEDEEYIKYLKDVFSCEK